MSNKFLNDYRYLNDCDKNEKFHFYLDEGGLLGTPVMSLLKDKRKRRKSQGLLDDVYDYYIGYMPLYSIIRYLYLFINMFDIKIIHIDSYSQIMMNSENLKRIKNST